MWPAIIIGAVILVIAILLIVVYNGLVGKRNQVRNAWGQIDVQLNRRHDLIPNLVNAVKGYMAHEQGVLERIAQTRSQAIAAGSNVPQRAEAENQLTGALRSLFAVAENYPQLRASENMLALQEELASTENRIAFSRQHYNDSVMEYNTARETVPAVFFAGMLGFAKEPLFTLEASAPERAVPQVAF